MGQTKSKILILSAAIVTLLVSCEQKRQSVTVEEVTLDAEAIELTVGDTRQLTASVLPGDAQVETMVWESTFPDFASVSEDGLVTALAVGETTVMVTVNGSLTASCEVTVTESAGPRNIDMRGMTTEEARAAISEALDAGVTEFRLTGEFEKLGISTDTRWMDSSWVNNPFYRSNVEVIDFSGVTDWPEVDVDGLMDPTHYNTSTDGVYGLPECAFYGMADGEYLFPKLREIILPEEVKALGSQSLWNNPSLETVRCPGVLYIGNQLVCFCTSLNSIDMGEVTTVYFYAFMGSGITSVSLPKAKELYYGLFNDCSLTDLELTASGNMTMHENPIADLTGERFFDFETSSCSLVLNADKHYSTGTADPRASSSTEWFDAVWSDIAFQ